MGLNAVLEDEIVSAYAAGESAASLAGRYGVAPASVYYWLKKRGVPVHRPDARPRRSMTVSERAIHDQTLALHYAAGLPSRAVAKITGVGPQTVMRAVQRHGVPLNGRPWTPNEYVADGYVFVRVRPSDPHFGMADTRGYVRKHRLVFARALGRDLRLDEQVHHRNGRRSENGLDNLQLRVGNHGTGMVLRCRCCGSVDVEFAEV